MFPVRISSFNEGVLYADVIQHVIMFGVFTNDTIYTVFSFFYKKDTKILAHTNTCVVTIA